MFGAWRIEKYLAPYFQADAAGAPYSEAYRTKLATPKISSLLFFQLLLFLTPIAKQIKVARSNGISYPKKQLLTTTHCLLSPA